MDRAEFIRALYDAAEKVLDDQMNTDHSPERAAENAARLASLLAQCDQADSADFTRSAKSAVVYMTSRLPENDK